MSSFFYTAKSFDGQTKTGVLDAKDKIELARSLRKEGFVLVEASTKDPVLRGGHLQISFLERWRGISMQEKLVFVKNVRLMLRAGVGVGRAIHTLGSQTKNSEFRKILFQAEEKVLKGSTLADAFSGHPQAFNELFVSMVRVGEESGTLDNSLQILANQIEKDYRLRSKVRGAMTYPAVIVVTMIVIGILMMLLVVPKLQAVFIELKIELPPTTKIVIGISSFLRKFWFIIPFGVAGFFAGVRFLHRTKKGRELIDTFLLRPPIVGGLIRKMNTARTARILGSLIASGVPIVRSLEIAASTLGNVRFQQVLLSACDRVRRGGTLHEHFAAYGELYPSIASQMIEVGEETGNLTAILEQMAEFYEGEVDEITKNLSSIIEPVLMIAIGITVGFFAVSMIQPMYSMLSGI